MKKILAIFSCGLFLISCNSITTDYYLLNDENTDAFIPRYRYWQSDALDDNDVMALEFRGFEKNKKQKLWLLDGYPKAKKDLPIYIRMKAVAGGKQLLQLTSWENGNREISLLFGKMLNDSTMLLYGYDKSIFNTVKYSSTLKDFRQHIKLTDSDVFFDSIAATTYRKPLLRFLMQELPDSKHFISDSLIFKGSENPQSF